MERIYRILIIDDELNVIKSIIRVLDAHFNFEIVYSTSPEEALDLIKNNKFDIIISDHRMPKITGIEILKYAKEVSPFTVRILITGYTDIEVVISAINEGNTYRYISKPWDNEKLVKTIEDALSYKVQLDYRESTLYELTLNNRTYEDIVNQLRQELDLKDLQITKALLKIIKARDEEIFIHSKNVYNYAVSIAKFMNLSSKQIKIIKYASLFHDIGKIAIRDKILFKPSNLSDDEYNEIKYHSLIGSEIIKELDFMQEISIVVSQHHERIDGKGYPFGLKSEEIMLEAKILSVADCYDALTSNRVYRKEISQEDAIEILKEGIGNIYDEKIVNIFIKILVNKELSTDDLQANIL